MHDLGLVLTLTGALAAALPLGYLTHRLGLSPLVGYLLAGIAVGPYTPGFVADRALAADLAEIGVMLLLFGVGLEFHLEALLGVRRVAIPGAIGQSLVATVLGWLVGVGLGWSSTAGIVFGLAISVASTVVLVRVLSDNRDLHTPSGHLAVGWLVVEDLLTVLVLVLLPLVAAEAAPGAGGMALAIGGALVKIGLLVVFTVVVGGRLVPWLLRRVAATRSRELFTLAVLVVALGIAVLSARVFGVSMALGAFLAGMVVGRSDFSLRAASDALPMRDAFAVLFFVSVGMLFDPAALAAEPVLIAATLAVILIGKPLAALALVRLFGQPLRVGMAVSLALAQVGEFSFLLAALGRELGILPASAMSAIVAAALLSIGINPLLYRGFARWRRGAGRRSGEGVAAVASPPARVEGQPPSEGGFGAIVVGYGPIGQTVSRLLAESDVVPTVIELNPVTAARLKAEGVVVVHGDASRREVLLAAGAERAVALILSASDMPGAEEAIRGARELNPAIRVFARSVHLREVPRLRAAGADAVFSGEGEVALGMTEFILRQLGATADQIDRERARLRSEVLGEAAAVGPLLPPRGPVPATPGE